jgi:hypothetical protein
MKHYGTNKGCSANALIGRFNSELQKRYDLQRQQDALWQKTRNHQPNPSLMTKINKSIGDSTHKLNGIIEQLSHFKVDSATHDKAVNYLQSEIARTQKIHTHWVKTIKQVNQGKCCLIDANGRTHSNTADSVRYVSQLEEKIRYKQRLLSRLRSAR